MQTIWAKTLSKVLLSPEKHILKVKCSLDHVLNPEEKLHLQTNLSSDITRQVNDLLKQIKASYCQDYTFNFKGMATFGLP